MTEEQNPEVQELLDKAKAQMLLALSRVGAFDEANTDTTLDVMRRLADRDGTINVVECRDRIGMTAQLLHLVLRVVVAEERIEARTLRRPAHVDHQLREMNQ